RAESRDGSDAQGVSTNRKTFNWRSVEEQPGERDKRANEREKTSKQTGRGAWTKRKARRAGKASRRPGCHDGNTNQRKPTVKFARGANLETQPAPVRGGFDPLGHFLSSRCSCFLICLRCRLRPTSDH